MLFATKQSGPNRPNTRAPYDMTPSGVPGHQRLPPAGAVAPACVTNPDAPVASTLTATLHPSSEAQARCGDGRAGPRT